MISSILVVSFFIGLALLLLIFKYLENDSVKFISIVIFILLLWQIPLLFQHSNQYNVRSSLNFNRINIAHESTNNGLIIKNKSGTNILYDNIKNQEVTYFKDKKDVSSILYTPVYLRNLRNYYLVVFSTNQNKDYSAGRFIQGEYDFFNADQLCFIRKSDGVMIFFKDYELIGKTIDLNTIENIDNFVIYRVFVDFETDISFVGLYEIDETIRINITTIITKIHYHGEDYSYVKKFVTSNDFVFMWTNSYNKVFVNTKKDGGHLSMNPITSYMDQTYIIEGYFTNYNGDIYYVDNDLKIRKLNVKGEDLFIADVINLSNWESQLLQKTS